jgi:hypothetical protein
MPGSIGLNFGTAALGDPSAPSVNSIACPSAGNCSAGGEYVDRAGRGQALVVNEVGGRWQRAIEVPGSAALDLGGHAEINSVACASAGNCSAGGDYTTRAHQQEALVVTEVGGSWQGAIEVPATGALNRKGDASVVSVSCRSPGNCSAGGYYSDRAGFQAFVVNEVAGTWGAAVEVPGLGPHNVGGNAQVRSVSCGAPGNCSAGGYYAPGRNAFGAFVVNETGGTWGQAEAVPNSARLDSGRTGGLEAVSCSAAGECGAVGDYLTVVKHRSYEQPFVVSEKGGVWGLAEPLRVPYRLTAAGQVDATALSCASPGNCSLGGSYWDKAGGWLLFVASEANGVWRAAAEIPGTAGLNAGANGQVNSISCGAGGYCAAVGFVTTARRAQQAFVVLQSAGAWHGAQILPNSERLNTGDTAEVGAVSCTPSGFCGAGGDYTLRSGSRQLLVDNFIP